MPGVRANKTHPYALDQGMFTALNAGLFSSKNETGGRQGALSVVVVVSTIQPLHPSRTRKPLEQYTSQYTVQPSKSLVFRVKALQVGDKHAQYFSLYTPNHVRLPTMSVYILFLAHAFIFSYSIRHLSYITNQDFVHPYLPSLSSNQSLCLLCCLAPQCSDG